MAITPTISANNETAHRLAMGKRSRETVNGQVSLTMNGQVISLTMASHQPAMGRTGVTL
jgi:hypothetical protein